MPNWNIIKRSFKSTLTTYISIFVITIAMFGLAFMAVSITHNMSVEKPNPSRPFNAIQSFSQTYYHPIALILFGISALMLPMTLLTKEIENTSLAIMLVSKNSRQNVLLSKFTAIFMMLFIYFIVQMLLGIAVIAPYAEGNQVAQFINLNWSYFIGTLVLTSIVFLSASYFDKKLYVWLIGGLILVFSVIFGLVAELKESLSFLQYVSVFAFANLDAIKNGDLSMLASYLVGITATIGMITGSVYIFKNRDLQL